MESKKLPNELSINELLEKVDSGEDIEDGQIFEFSHDVISFISAFALQKGNETVDKRLLFDLYHAWSKNPVTSYKFNLIMGKYFPLGHINYTKYGYWINTDAMKVTEETIALLLKNKKYKQKSPRWNLHFNAFLNHFNITSGIRWLEGDILYWLYGKWVWETNKKLHLSYDNFIQFLDSRFEKKRIGTSRIRFYGINEEVDTWFRENFIDEFRKQRKAKKKKRKATIKRLSEAAIKAHAKKKQKIEREVSKSQSESESKE